MSYILEAIRRSEQERRRRMTPDISTVHAVRPPRSAGGSRSGYAALAGGLVLALAAALALQTWPRMTASEQEVVAATGGGAGLDQARAGANTVPPADAESDANLAATPPRAENAPSDATDAAEDPPQHPPAAAATETRTETKRPRRPYSSARAAPQAEPQPKASEKGAAGISVGAGDGAVPADAPADVGARAAEVVSAIALRDLPAPLQRSLPDISITLHRYAETAAARMIRVNGRIAREGDPVTGDLSVAEITRSGVVFVIGDQRFYMDAFQTWQAKNGP